jgi:hypothetical protein
MPASTLYKAAALRLEAELASAEKVVVRKFLSSPPENRPGASSKQVTQRCPSHYMMDLQKTHHQRRSRRAKNKDGFREQLTHGRRRKTKQQHTRFRCAKQ